MRYSSLSQINRDNVARLKVAWVFPREISLMAVILSNSRSGSPPLRRLSRSRILVHYVAGEISLRHMSSEPVSGQLHVDAPQIPNHWLAFWRSAFLPTW